MSDSESQSLPFALPTLTAPPRIDPDGPLLHTEAASDRRWWLAGRRTHLDFDGAAGLVGARFDGGVNTARLAWVDAPDQVVISPRATRFERASAAGRFSETLWVPERLAGLVADVRPTRSWEDSARVEGTLHVGLPSELSSVAGDPSARWIEIGDGEGLLAVAIGPEGPAEVFGSPHIEGTTVSLPISFRPPTADASLTLLVLAGEAAPSSLRTLAAVRAHARRGLPAEEALRTRTGNAGIDAEVGWAWTRMRDRIVDGVGPLPSLPDSVHATWVRTAIAAGQPDAARAVLAHDPTSPDQAAAWEAWAAGMGPGGLLDELEHRVGAAEGRPSELRTALARVADRAGADAWASALRRAEAGSTRRLTLPSIGAPPGDAPASKEDAPDAASDGVSEASRRTTTEAWCARAATPSSALDGEGWRILGDLVTGVLGWSPDAASGRMHMTPTIPEGWDRLSLSGLRGGELRLRLEWSRTGDTEMWRFAPMAGAVPATLILRLPVPDESTPVEIDGVPAELDAERSEGVVRVPIQIQLDRERVVRVGEPAGAESPDATQESPTSG